MDIISGWLRVSPEVSTQYGLGGGELSKLRLTFWVAVAAALSFAVVVTFSHVELIHLFMND